jgi:hypothetical protein
MWFNNLMGFAEQSPDQVRRNLTLDGTQLTSLVNGKSYECGVLQIPKLEELRQTVPQQTGNHTRRIKFSETIGNVQDLHFTPENRNALFQVASQFNLLEMASPNAIPEDGVGIYEHDHTQGPACAIAAGAGTVFRNYLVPLENQTGQTADKQVDCLADVGHALGNENQQLWSLTNGYAFGTREGLNEISNRLARMDESGIDLIRSQLRVGIMWNTEVTLGDSQNRVSQIYCSAVPVSYSNEPESAWEPFARLILEATYEATFCAAARNRTRHDSNVLFLTLIGGGVFGNRKDWITSAIQRAMHLYRNHELDVRMVSYNGPNPDLKPLFSDF